MCVKNNKIDCPFLVSLVNFHVPTCNTRFHIPFTIPFSFNNYETNATLSRIMRYANENPSFLMS